MEKIKLDFIGIGAQKAGTTWLYQMLNQHSQISFGNKKEIHFFNDKSSFYTMENTYNFSKGLKWYKEQLQIDKNKLNGDISPNYMWDEKSVYRIKKHFPNVKIIVVLRNPIDRAYSQYLFASQRYFISKTFEGAINKYPEFLQRGLYYKQLKPYYDIFPKNNIKMILFDDIQQNPKKVLHEVYKFLDIEEIFPENIFKKVNKTKTTRFFIITKINSHISNLKTTRVGNIMWKNKSVHKFIKNINLWIKKINTKEQKSKQELSIQTRDKLIDYFQDDIKYLEKLSNRDLSNWLSRKD